MTYMMSYTKKGSDVYSELNDAMHLALSRDGKNFQPLRHNTGILFAEADFTDGGLAGKTKCLADPWIFRYQDQTWGVLAIRRNRGNQPDNRKIGHIMVYQWKTPAEYVLTSFLKVSDKEVRRPACRYDEEKKVYRLEWDQEEESFCGETTDFIEIKNVRKEARIISDGRGETQCDIQDAVVSNIIEITEAEEQYLRALLETPVLQRIEIKNRRLSTKSVLEGKEMLEAEGIYSDGSKREIPVDWDKEELEAFAHKGPGEYEIHGKLRKKHYPVPFTERTGDPFIMCYHGRYLMTWSGGREVTIRATDTLEGLHKAAPKVIYRIPEDQPEAGNMWAPEFHEIQGVLYLFTTIGKQGLWYTVQSCILKCKGNPENPEDWEEPVFCMKKDGSALNEKGITLDMTCFCVEDRYYVMWSDRILDRAHYEVNSFGTNGDATLCIAEIDPQKPWKLISDPVCICRPKYGWDRIENEINEGPYFLEHGEDLFVTFSGSSVGVLYCVGLLRTKKGSNLLDPYSWKELPYPVLTKESVPRQFGPGHNCFIKDPDRQEDDLIVLHAKEFDFDDPEDEDIMKAKNPRNSIIRRVHWNRLGYPVLDMQEHQDIPELLREIHGIVTFF